MEGSTTNSCYLEQEEKSDSGESGEVGKTDQKNALERKKGMLNLFKICPDFQHYFSEVNKYLIVLNALYKT